MAADEQWAVPCPVVDQLLLGRGAANLQQARLAAAGEVVDPPAPAGHAISFPRGSRPDGSKLGAWPAPL